MDIYCSNGTETALHHVVKMREHTITHRLLQAGANPNLIIYAAESPESNGSHSSSASINESQPSPPSQTYYKGKLLKLLCIKFNFIHSKDLIFSDDFFGKYSAKDLREPTSKNSQITA